MKKIKNFILSRRTIIALILIFLIVIITGYIFPQRFSTTTADIEKWRDANPSLVPWVDSIGLDATAYGTHSMRRTKATLIYRRTKNLRAVQLLLGHSSLDSTVRYLGIEIDDALEMSEQTDV